MTMWGLYRLRDLIGSREIQVKLNDGRWGRAVPVPYPGNRIRTAWAVLRGKAFAVEWPSAEEVDFVAREMRRPY